MSGGDSLWEKYKNLLNTEVHLFSRRDSMVREAGENDQLSPEPREGSAKKEERLKIFPKTGLRRIIPSKKQAILSLAVAVLVIAAFVGGYFTVNWYMGASASEPGGKSYEQDDYGDWKTYQNKTQHLEIRYPADWEAEEAKTGPVLFKPAESVVAVKDHIFVRATSAKGRAQNACEKDYKKCSFYANGIFGERTTTPEAEEIFFGHGKSDFYVTLYKYNSDEEVVAEYTGIFEKLAGSFRFLGEATKACKSESDCVLVIRIDKCCSCPEAVSQTELKANSSLVAWEADKDYSGQKLLDCANVYCSECLSQPTGVGCIENFCQ